MEDRWLEERGNVGKETYSDIFVLKRKEYEQYYTYSNGCCLRADSGEKGGKHCKRKCSDGL